MADFSLRPAAKADFPAIRRLIHEVNINPTGLDWRRFLLAVSAENELLGCGQIKPHGDGSIELASIAVRKEARGQGIARAVIEELLTREATRPVYLMCRARLEPLYEKFGFRTIAFDEMPRYFKSISRAERIFNKDADPLDRLRVMRLDEWRRI